jgi:hypothetical protein
VGEQSNAFCSAAPNIPVKYGNAFSNPVVKPQKLNILDTRENIPLKYSKQWKRVNISFD